jgi:hypothetical protein
LGLEAVKPVRNDLSDSDLVVVQGPRPAVAADELARQPVWARFKSRWLGVGST